MTTNIERRIYVASLSDYNAGILHGVWIDVDGKDVDDIMEEVREMLKASPATKQYGDIAEEWAIHDHEGFHGLIGEYTGLDMVVALAEALEEHGEAYAEYLEYFGRDCGTVKDFKGRYLGEWDSEEDYAQNYVDDSGLLAGVDETIQRYFDYEAYTRDLFMDGYVFLNGHVFFTA